MPFKRERMENHFRKPVSKCAHTTHTPSNQRTHIHVSVSAAAFYGVTFYYHLFSACTTLFLLFSHFFAIHSNTIPNVLLLHFIRSICKYCVCACVYVLFHAHGVRTETLHFSLSLLFSCCLPACLPGVLVLLLLVVDIMLHIFLLPNLHIIDINSILFYLCP